MKINTYRFKFNSGWHINLLLEADDLEDAKKKFTRYYKKEFNGQIIKL
jgi:hypothetical protein